MEFYNSIIERLNSQHFSVKDIIRNLDETTLMKQPEPGKWSIHENLAHITGYHHVLLERLNKILEDENPFFPRYAPVSDPEFNKWLEFNSEELLTHLKENRNAMNTFLLNLTSEDLSKIGTHQKFGKMNIVEWTEFFLLHEAHHIYTIFKIKHQFHK